MNTLCLLLALLLITTTFARPESTTPSFNQDPKNTNTKGGNNNNNGNPGWFPDPGTGFGIPGFGVPGSDIIGGGYGGGYGGPTGGYSKGGVIRPTVVCKEKGPCYKKKLTCPAKCFTSYSRSGKNYGGGGGGGGCTMDCKKKCVAFC
ncbi:hypothetical protein GIB67_025059 [Kingdonia uniflora]|uniref:Glycine-rich protein n=1 Tax=Kingdonia uniflora TaxID=39325 RepID=A0A7J7N7S5_9MAGN|nr:hypothetical protein GIB67_025059 [Kingdonia uniflora]